MKRRGIITLLIVGLFTFALVGCGETQSSTQKSNKEATQKSSTEDSSNNEEATTEDTNDNEESTQENRQTILDNDTVKIEYVKTVKDDYETDIVFHAENKSSQNIIIQPENSISLDDTMYMAMASQDIMAGKKADFKVTLSSSDGSDFNIPDFSKASGTINVLNENYDTLVQQAFDISK